MLSRTGVKRKVCKQNSYRSSKTQNLYIDSKHQGLQSFHWWENKKTKRKTTPAPLDIPLMPFRRQRMWCPETTQQEILIMWLLIWDRLSFYFSHFYLYFLLNWKSIMNTQIIELAGKLNVTYSLQCSRYSKLAQLTFQQRLL